MLMDDYQDAALLEWLTDLDSLGLVEQIGLANQEWNERSSGFMGCNALPGFEDTEEKTKEQKTFKESGLAGLGS